MTDDIKDGILFKKSLSSYQALARVDLENTHFFKVTGDRIKTCECYSSLGDREGGRNQEEGYFSLAGKGLHASIC